MSDLIRTENVSVCYNGKTVLRDVSLAVGAGDFVTVVGPNGAGKSTLLQCMLGFFRPDSGRVVKSPGLSVGYLPQRRATDDLMPMRVDRFLRLRRRVRRAVWDATLDEVELAPLLKRTLHSLSGGQMQRVLLARALLGEPRLLVLDEPEQSMDISGRHGFYNLLARIYENRGVGVLMVSHDLHLVMSCTTRVVCLYHHICCTGRPHAISQDPEFVALFGPDVGRLMSVYHHGHDHTHNNVG